MSILIHVDHPGGTRITELAERAMMTKQSMGQLVADMETLGLAERITDPSDRRAKIVRLTDRGSAMHERPGEIVRGLEAAWAASLGEQKFAQLRQLLRELTAALDEG